jgi:hypothetical protein
MDNSLKHALYTVGASGVACLGIFGGAALISWLVWG